MLGGISSGMPIVMRCAVKPTSSIPRPQETITRDLEPATIAVKGRHDPCVGVRAGVTLESRLAIELMNAVLMHQAGRVDSDNFQLFSGLNS